MSDHPVNPNTPCPVTAKEQIPLGAANTPVVLTPITTPTIKVPVAIAEPTLQIVVESDIHLAPAATEIKRVKKNVFLNQVKLVPVTFARIDNTDFFRVTRGKLFVAGHIRKNIEYATAACNGVIRDRIVDVPFSGFADITFPVGAGGPTPVLGISESAEANFLNEKTGLDARLDKAFFQNLVKYNEQPYGELVAANFFEVDFSPHMTNPEGKIHTLREKIVLDLTVKIVQVQQLTLASAVSLVTPILPGLTPPV
ncbi:CsxC family protein [Bacillus sp. FJAT-49711]|uniref:CsxC family protein n=1 Tax=Bacillus sp. FJAT-49711 TaxID=2833585 RepID=UPI0020164763|nr:Uracil permease [Bacillus sp. FJAT-49711]